MGMMGGLTCIYLWSIHEQLCAVAKEKQIPAGLCLNFNWPEATFFFHLRISRVFVFSLLEKLYQMFCVGVYPLTSIQNIRVK